MIEGKRSRGKQREMIDVGWTTIHKVTKIKTTANALNATRERDAWEVLIGFANEQDT